MTPTPIRPLTPRQAEVVRLVARGFPYKRIALALGMSERTARQHVSAIALLLDSDDLTPYRRVQVWALAQDRAA
jgi:DNA-binding NarL/FixJ family response regulator